jgi:fido (protein-threonine AMPylation protein)
MSLMPGYGETPLPDDELAALLPDILQILGEPVTRAAVYDLEQGIQEQVAEELLTAALEASLEPSELLTDYLLKDLHARLYGDIWTWAGNGGRTMSTSGLHTSRLLSTSAIRWARSFIDGRTPTTGRRTNWVLWPMPRQ